MMHFQPLPNNPQSPLIAVASTIWTLEAGHPVYYRPPMQPRYPYPHRAVVVRLKDGSLFVVSPIQLTDAIRSAVDALGTVRYLVSPNHLHHLHLGAWSQDYPQAQLYASPGLPSKRKDLTFSKTLSTDAAEPEWAGQIDQVLFGTGNGWFDEMVFFHRASRTVIFTDLIMDFDPASFSAIGRVTSQVNQMYRHTPRGIQLAHPFDRATLRQALQTVQDWQPEYAIVAHSPWVCVAGQQSVAALLDAAFDWLTPRPALVETATSTIQLLSLLLVILPAHVLIVLFADILYPKLAQQFTQPAAGQ